MKEVSRSELLRENLLLSARIEILEGALKAIAETDVGHLPEWLAEDIYDKFYKRGDEYIALSSFARRTARHVLDKTTRLV